jgi:hypothetical protein
MKLLRHLLWKYITQNPQYEEKQVSCEEITIEGVHEELYTKLLAEATAAGAGFEGTKASLGGLEFDWNYDGVADVLHVTCTKKPFYVTCGVVESKIRDLVEKAKGSI